MHLLTLSLEIESQKTMLGYAWESFAWPVMHDTKPNPQSKAKHLIQAMRLISIASLAFLRQEAQLHGHLEIDCLHQLIAWLVRCQWDYFARLLHVRGSDGCAWASQLCSHLPRQGWLPSMCCPGRGRGFCKAFGHQGRIPDQFSTMKFVSGLE